MKRVPLLFIPLTLMGVACSTVQEIAGEEAPAGEPVAEGCSMVSATIEESWELALQRTKAAYETHSADIKKKDRVAVINYVTRGNSTDRLRLYDPTQDWKQLSSYWVSHAFKSDVAYKEGVESLHIDGCATQFSNVPETQISSKGAMVTAGRKEPSQWGREKLQVHGKDKQLNSKVFKRFIVFHQAVGEGGEDMTFSWGCFMLKPDDLDPVLDEIAGEALVYAHHE